MESNSTCAASTAAAIGGGGSDVTHADISEYYGKTVQKQSDLQTSACLVKGGLGEDIRRLLSNVHDEILSKFYGCGSPIPPLLKVQWNSSHPITGSSPFSLSFSHISSPPLLHPPASPRLPPPLLPLASPRSLLTPVPFPPLRISCLISLSSSSRSNGCTVLDLGCGTGRDVYVAAQLVGPTGQVIGVDMTDEQLAVARKHEEYHREKFGFAESNVSFRKGFIEDLKAANVEDSSVDVVVSNCTINLTPVKLPVFSEIARVLKPGGELYFSDVFADRRIPQHLRQDKVLFGEGFSGAHYLEDFRRLMASVGLGGWGVVEARQLHVDNPKIAAQIGPIKYYSFTVRAVKLPEGEGVDLPENYGQTATYSGSIPEKAGEFALDDVRVFKTGVPTPVDATTAAVLEKSRYNSVFTVTEKGAHQGTTTASVAKPTSCCGPKASAAPSEAKAATSSCCGPKTAPAPTEPTKSSCCGPKSAASPAAGTGAGSDVTHADVSEYYGKTVQQQTDLQTSACLVKGGLGEDIRRLLSNVHDEILSKFYGCGSPIPPLLKLMFACPPLFSRSLPPPASPGSPRSPLPFLSSSRSHRLHGCTVLDLGCGTGRDVYVAAQLVGPTGQVIGIDMTDEQLAVARKHEEYHREKFGFEKSNVSFRKGFIEDLKAANVEDSSVDVVVSNCVINLAPSKVPVIAEIARVLKTGGELYFSDVFADRRIPKHLQQDKVLFGECLSGALYLEDFRRLMASVLFGECLSGALYLEDFRRLMASVGLGGWGVVEARELDVENPEMAARVGPIKFYSLTVRAVKLPSGAGDGEGEDLPENYGQTATYSGSIPGQAGEFTLDDVRIFKAGVPTPVDATTAAMLTVSRYSSAFTVTEKGAHQGPFTGLARFPASVAGAWWSATVEKAKSGCC
ncbi:unnamed protein product [Closterium sp. NIES-65]|nr:unnamed protein product [Closterium sp. NIES-65]